MPGNGEVPDRPLAPAACRGGGERGAAVAVPADGDAVVPLPFGVGDQHLKEGDVPALCRLDFYGGRQRRRLAGRQVGPALCGPQRSNLLHAPLRAPHRGAVVVHLDATLCDSGGGVRLGSGDFVVGAGVSGVAVPVDDVTGLHAGWIRGRIVHGNGFEAGPFQGVPDALGAQGAAVEAADPFPRGQLHAPARGPVGAGVRSRRQGRPIGRRPDREGGGGLVYRPFGEHAGEVRQDPLGGELLHHRGYEAVHAVRADPGVHSCLRLGQPGGYCARCQSGSSSAS